MTYQYLLDTNILSDLVRHPQGLVFQHIAAVGEDTVCTSIIVACELRFGAIKSSSVRLAQQLEQILAILPVLPLELSVAQHYALIRQQLEQAGTPIGPNDLLIAAHALALNLTLVTANTREFERIPTLSLDNWLLPGVDR
jgi:tRNA(fMet)-specific endonuclease VapC